MAYIPKEINVTVNPITSTRPSIGRVVHFVVRPRSDGQEVVHYPAIIVAVRDVDVTNYLEKGYKGGRKSQVEVILKVFGMIEDFRTPWVRQDEDGEVGTWHWPERE